jgi:hypothetical protein
MSGWFSITATESHVITRLSDVTKNFNSSQKFCCVWRFGSPTERWDNVIYKSFQN